VQGYGFPLLYTSCRLKVRSRWNEYNRTYSPRGGNTNVVGVCKLCTLCSTDGSCRQDTVSKQMEIGVLALAMNQSDRPTEVCIYNLRQYLRINSYHGPSVKHQTDVAPATKSRDSDAQGLRVKVPSVTTAVCRACRALRHAASHSRATRFRNTALLCSRRLWRASKTHARQNRRCDIGLRVASIN